MSLVLSIFPGIDLLGRAFEEEGFVVVRGPDLIFGGDIRTFHPPAGKFDGVIGGPPCKGESSLAHLNGTVGVSMADEFRRVVAEASPRWWIMEAVKKHPAPHVLALSPRWLGEPQSRLRYFHSNLPIERHAETFALEPFEYAYAVRAANRASGLGTVRRGMASYHWHDMKRLQGLPDDFGLPLMTRRGKEEVVGNGVPLAMGRAVAKAVRRAMTPEPAAGEELGGLGDV